jgi:hypothetical protein
MKCADANPWDPAILCELADGHTQRLHEAPDCIRWSDECHWPGDACPPFTHPAEASGGAA